MVKKLRADLLASAVAATRDLDMDIVVHQAVDSTNSWCMQQCKDGRKLPFACFAESQTSGRGRRGKRWAMLPNSNIAMSLSWSFVRLHPKLHLLPLSIAMAIVATLEHIGLRHVQVKWPNDVFVQGRKIAGILIETQPLNDKEVAVVIGVGLNYDMSVLRYDQSLDLPVLTDICYELESGQKAEAPQRSQVAALLLQRAVEVCQSFHQDAEWYLEKFRARYDFCLDKNIEIILDNGEKRSGVATGVNDKAELLVMIDGKQQVFNSAEVSVKA